MTTQAIGAVWSEPRAPGAEGPRSRDWGLVALIVVAAGVETALRDDLVWRVASLAVAVLGAGVLPWRRVRPLVATALAVGVATAVSLAALAGDVRWDGLDTGIFFLLLPYSLGRWGSGREVIGGAGVFTVILTLTAIAGISAGDLVGGVAVLVLAGAVGAGIRYRQIAHRQELAGVRHESAPTWHANCTTPSRTTSRPSPSKPKPGDPSPAPMWTRPRRSSRWSRSRHPARSKRCARWLARSVTATTRTSAHPMACTTSNGSLELTDPAHS